MQRSPAGNNKILKIDPLFLKAEEKEIFDTMLQQNLSSLNAPNIKVFTALSNNKPVAYFADLILHDKMCSVEIHLQRDIVVHIKNNSRIDKAVFTGHVFTRTQASSLGNGLTAAVYPLDGKIKQRPHGSFKYKRGSTKVVKIGTIGESYIPSDAQRENTAAKFAKHLEAKNMLRELDQDGMLIHTYLMMKRLYKQEFFDLLELDVSNKFRIISVTQRIRLSYNFARALDEQIHASGLIYRDLKPENCLVDDLKRIKICDVGFAVHRDKPDHHVLGTPLWISPDQPRRGYASDIRNDCYSLGLILSCIWFGTIRQGTDHDIYMHVLRNKETAQHSNAARIAEFTNLPLEQASMVVDAISSLLRPIEKRASAKQTAESFCNLELQRCNPALKSEIHTARELALATRAQLQTMETIQHTKPLQVLAEYLLAQVEKLHEHPDVISAFVEDLDLETFLHCKSKKFIQAKIHKMLADFAKYTDELEKLHGKTADPSMSLDLVDDIKSLHFKMHKVKRRHTFAEYEKILEKYQLEIADIDERLYPKVRASKLGMFASAAREKSQMQRSTIMLGAAI